MDWFRMYGDMPNNPKIGTLSDSDFRTWVELLCAACTAEKNGNTGLTKDNVNWALRRNVTETFQKLFDVNLVRFNEAGEIIIVAWEKRQYVSDSSTSRVKKYREKQRASRANQAQENYDNETLLKRFSNGVEQNRADTEQSNNPTGLFVASEAADRKDCPHQQIIDLYHEVLPMCPRVKDWTPARATQLRARWNEDKLRQNIDWWRRLFEYILRSDFLTGRKAAAGKEPFFATLNWITKAENFAKIREGNYENRKVA